MLSPPSEDSLSVPLTSSSSSSYPDASDSVLCDDGLSQCPENQICCPLEAGGYGCCPSTEVNQVQKHVYLQNDVIFFLNIHIFNSLSLRLLET